MKTILLLILSWSLISCSTTADIKRDADMKAIFAPAPSPVEPEWVVFTRKPVVQSFDREGTTNFEVSDQFVERALQSKDYAERIKKWKKQNLIP